MEDDPLLWGFGNFSELFAVKLQRCSLVVSLINGSFILVRVLGGRDYMGPPRIARTITAL